MQRRTFHGLTLAVAALGMCSLPVSAATTIEWWHAMGGELGDKVNQIAADFNASQDDYVVKPVFKGTYTETMTAAIAAFRAHRQPDIVQVFEVGTESMMAAKGAVYPVYQLMDDYNEPFDPDSFLTSVTGYYTTNDGKMLSMPFNSSTPVLYYNKAAFAQAGVDQPPKTWEEMGEVGEKLLENGQKCGFTTGWQSWIQLENFSARHDLPFASENDGFGGIDARLEFNGPKQVKHIAQLAKWQQSGVFSYGGRESNSGPKFYTGECAMLTASSASYAAVKSHAKFDFGVAPLPYWASMTQHPQNTIIGGASLWVLQGKPKSHYKGVAEFYKYLSSAKVQADWHQFSGYLPITKAAYKLTREQGFYDQHPGTDVAVKQMLATEPTVNSKGLRLGNFPQIRNVINEEFEKVWAGDESAKEALDNAVTRGNKLLEQFEKSHS